MKQQDYYNSKKELTLLRSIEIGTPEDSLKEYNEWLKKQINHKDDNILRLLHTAIRYGFTNIVKTILSSEEGCLAILSDESLVKEATHSKHLNLEIINALYDHKNTMTAPPFDDVPEAPTIQGHIVDAFQDRKGNLYPGGGSSSSTWKEVKAFQTTTGELIELTPDLMVQLSNEPHSKKRSASELENPIQHKQIKIEGMPKAVFQDQEGRFNIDPNAPLRDILEAQDFLNNQLRTSEYFVQNHSLSKENILDPLAILAGVAAIHDTSA